jgi:hypothetical protein
VGYQVDKMRKVASILQTSGIRVTETKGWTTRGRTRFEPRAVVVHWTTSRKSITAMLINGRKGKKPVPGPLCNFELLPGREGVKLIAAGRANHAGDALTRFSNSVAFGIEAAGPPIGDEQFKVYHALVAAICRVYDIPVGQGVRDHFEVALPHGRKVDISGSKLKLSRDHNMNVFRNKVAKLLSGPVEPRPPRKDGKLWYPGLRKIGMHGAATGPGAFIAFIQRRLNAWGVAHPPLSADGDFGGKTRDAVVAFQEERGIKPPNGEVGPRVWYALQDKPK